MSLVFPCAQICNRGTARELCRGGAAELNLNWHALEAHTHNHTLVTLSEEAGPVRAGWRGLPDGWLCLGPAQAEQRRATLT